jgi:hypothetical protein
MSAYKGYFRIICALLKLDGYRAIRSQAEWKCPFIFAQWNFLQFKIPVWKNVANAWKMNLLLFPRTTMDVAIKTTYIRP